MGFRLRTFGLLSILTILLVLIGYALALWMGISVTYTVTGAFALAMGINLFSYWYSHKWVLKMYKAKIVSESEEPKLHEIIGRLASRADLPKPRVAVTPDDTPNAFATGRNPSNAVVAVTSGAKDLLSERELEGVLGHEMAHIKNRDMLVNTMAAMIAGAIAYIGIMGRFGILFGRRDAGWLALLALILMPIAAMMVRFAISRTREYGADEEGAHISGKPRALADALRRIESAVKRKQTMRRGQEEGNPVTSHIFIVNPFRGADLVRLFSTHPPTKERIRRLEKIVYW